MVGGAKVTLGLGIYFVDGPHGHIYTGIGFDWLNLPGTIVGCLAALHVTGKALRNMKTIIAQHQSAQPLQPTAGAFGTLSAKAISENKTLGGG